MISNEIIGSLQWLMDERHKEHRHIIEQYKSKAEYYICSCLNKNNNGSNVERTPAGLLHIRQWNNMQYVSTAAFLLTINLISNKKQPKADYDHPFDPPFLTNLQKHPLMVLYYMCKPLSAHNYLFGP